MDFKQKLSLVAGGVLGSVTSFYISLDATIKILMLFMVLDFALGVTKGYLEKLLFSNAMFKGAIRKGLVFTIIIVAQQLSITTQVPAIKDMTVIYYISMETLSIFEHAVDFDVPLPKFLLKFAERLKQENDEIDVMEE